MKRFFSISKLMLTCLIIVGAFGIASAQKLPVIDGKETVAMVNDEPIFLDELNQAIIASHSGKSGEQKTGRIDFSSILERLITIRLILIEARNMGLDELPEIQEIAEAYSKKTMMELLIEQHVKNITADEDEIEKLYKEEVKELKVKEVMVKKEADAKRIEAEIKAGGNFDDVAQKAVAAGIAEGGKEAFLKYKDLKPQVVQLISKLETGAVSPIIPIDKKGFIIFKLEGFHTPEKENPEAMENARMQALLQKKRQTANDYYEDLKKRYVNLNEKLLEAVDYESKEPGFENLLKDERVVAEFKGGDSITIGELSQALKKEFFHGIEKAIEDKRINKRKRLVLEGMIEKRVLLKEAAIQGIDKTETYKNKVKDYEKSLVFGTFIQKVIASEIKLNEKELKAYYENNSQKYTSPKMMRIKSLVFAKKKDAVDTLDKLMKGTDFAWLNTHADGQIDKTAEGLLKFEDRMLIIDTMPEDVQKAVSGVKPGEFRLYTSPEGHYYVLYIYHVVAPSIKPFEEVSKEIAKHVYNDKINRALNVYADKLKEYYPVKIFLK